MGVAGGMIGAYLVTRDPFWMMSGALIGVISSAPALDLYYPGLAFLVSFGGGCVMPKLNDILVEKFKIDDAALSWPVSLRLATRTLPVRRSRLSVSFQVLSSS